MATVRRSDRSPSRGRIGQCFPPLNESAGAAERIEHHVASRRTIKKSVRHHRDRLDSRMRGKVAVAITAKRIYACVVPDVGSIAAVTCQFNIISVPARSHTKHAVG